MDCVNQNATPPTNSPRKGRPTAFNRDEVVAAAMNVFWEKGFDNASLDELTADIGISRSTLYNSFGGKDGLYDSASTAYLDYVVDVMVQPLVEGSAGIADLIAFLRQLAHITTTDEMPAGCLIINAISTAAPSPETDRYLAQFETGFRLALTRAADHGEIAVKLVDPLVAILVAQTIGINITSKLTNPSERIQQSIEGLIAVIDALRAPVR